MPDSPTRVALSEVVEILSQVDAAPTFAGALSVEASGASPMFLLVEARRLCWATASSRSPRLRDLLRSGAGMRWGDDAAEAAEIHRAIRRHIAEAIIDRVGSSMRSVGWTPHSGDGYQARISFSPIDILVDVGAELYPRECESARRGEIADLQVPIASFAVDDDAVAAIRWSASSADPGEVTAATVAGPRVVDASVRGVARLGEWSSTALSASGGFSQLALARLADEAAAAGRAAAIGWRSARGVIHAVVASGTQIEATTSELTRRGFPVVASARHHTAGG